MNHLIITSLLKINLNSEGVRINSYEIELSFISYDFPDTIHMQLNIPSMNKKNICKSFVFVKIAMIQVFCLH